MVVEVLSGVLIAVGVVTVFAVVAPARRAQRTASVLKEQLAHWRRSERRAMSHAVVRGERVVGDRQREALAMAESYWEQRWTAATSTGLVVMMAGLALEQDKPGWLLALLIVSGAANAVLAVWKAFRAAAGRRYVRGAQAARV